MSAAEAIKALQLCFAVYQAGNTRLPVDPRTIDDLVVPDGMADVRVTRTLHHSVNVRGQPRRPPSPSTATSWGWPPTPVRRSPGSAATGSPPATPSSTWWTPTPATAGIRPTGPHVCFAVDDLDAAIAELEAGGIPYLRGAQGPVVQIWFADPAGNTVEIQQDPDRPPTGTVTAGT